MQNKKIKVKLQFDKGDKLLDVSYIPLTETVVNVKPIANDLNNGCLLVRKHSYLQTQFIMTGAGACFIILFDDQGKYVSSRINNGDSKAPFSSFISDTYVLILPSSAKVKNLHKQRLTLSLPDHVKSPSSNNQQPPTI